MASVTGPVLVLPSHRRHFHVPPDSACLARQLSVAGSGPKSSLRVHRVGVLAQKEKPDLFPARGYNRRHEEALRGSRDCLPGAGHLPPDAPRSCPSPVSGTPIVREGEAHSALRPGGPWLAYLPDSVDWSELICLDGTRVLGQKDIAALRCPEFDTFPLYLTMTKDGRRQKLIRCADGQVLWEE